MGFPVANFGIAGEITADGRILSRLWTNPSRQGAELEALPSTEIKLEGEPRPMALRWPFASVGALRCLAPVGSAFITSLPVILIENRGERTVIAHYDPEGYYANEIRSKQELIDFAQKHWDELWHAASEFEKGIPSVGDPDIDGYLRWYMTAGVALTKLFRNGDVATMGYTELNQRDSYWASWIHLVYWPELERRMIEESAAHQREDGRIPTTILPLIDRKDDLDISEYFILRVWRYFEWTGDIGFLRASWPSVQRALDYLKGRGEASPEQQSFWADWKDVPGVDGRLHSPHVALLWLAVVDRVKKMANVLGEAPIEIRASAENLWNGRFYANLWRDGRVDPTVAEEQCVGPLFGVVPADRIPKIYEALQANETPWGVRESFPYRTNFGYEPGDYHNGGIWPFLNSVDAFSRFVCGRREEGLRILRKVGRADLEAEGDYLPHENLHGETGKNIRHPIQAWNAAYFAAVFFGALKARRISEDEAEIERDGRRVLIPIRARFDGRDRAIRALGR